MFNIANQIAYENTMLYKTIDNSKTKKLVLEKSKWIDIKGETESEKDHYVKEQGQEVLNILEKALIINDYKFPEIFIITPFKDIETELRKELLTFLKKKTAYQENEIKEWTKKNCGTIHTFQGDETNEVIIVLGCSNKQSGPINWASQTPNILNVAVTRAKHRIAIIGEAQLWKKREYFSTAYKLLKEDDEN